MLSELATSAVVGVLCGATSALFLRLLDRVTLTREHHPSLVLGLPLAGLALGSVLHRWGKPAEGGMSLVLTRLHEGGPPLPARMAPLALGGTLLTHLFGGSAGREGTAVQMGASLADLVAHTMKADAARRRSALLAGIAGGFGSVFGTPCAGAIFALEVPTVGAVGARSLAPALTASIVGDLTARALGATHTALPAVAPLAPSALTVAKVIALGVALGLAARAFVALTRLVKQSLDLVTSSPPLRMALGGGAVSLLALLPNSSAYLGLGMPSIVAAFTTGAPWYAPAAKALFTAVTVGCGFVGGEVTPLFFVGSTLGAALSPLVGLPLDLCAGVGLAAVFGAAARTPIALTLMAIEVLGHHVAPHAAIACTVAAVIARGAGLYRAQRTV